MKAKLRFDSIIELAEWIRVVPRIADAGTTSSSAARKQEWDLHLGYKGAMAMAEAGGYWEKGSTLMQAGVAEAQALVSLSPQPTVTYAVAGFMPDVPAYLAGVPDNMLAMSDSGIDSPQPIVTMAIPNSLGNVEADELMNRGIAIVTLVDLLEASGTRCEVYAGLGCQEGSYCLDATVCVKKAEHTWAPATMAFGIAHPAMYRRLGFAVRERHEASVRATANGGYGDSTIVDQDQYTLVFPRLTGQNGWRTVAEALDTVETMARAAGINVTLKTK